jgi:hypothetical protein
VFVRFFTLAWIAGKASVDDNALPANVAQPHLFAKVRLE